MEHRRVAFLIVVLLSLSILTQCNITKEFQYRRMIIPVKHYEAAYVTHEPFNITSDVDFETQAWPGNGSLSNPYLIENLNITTNNSTCIWVMNTTSHFIIQNCLFVSPVYDYVGNQPLYPLTLTNVSNGVIQGNYVKNSSAGFSGYSLSACTISENEFNVTNYGIVILWSNHTTIFNNTQEFNPCYSSLLLNGGTNYTVSQNRFGNIRYLGITAWSIYNSSFVQNTLIGSDDIDEFPWIGIEVWGGTFCKVRQNEIANFRWSGINVQGGNHLIEDNNVTNGNFGIRISATDCIVRRNNLSTNSEAIVLVAANRTTVFENTITGRNGRYDMGIAMHGGYDCEVYLNDINYVGHGLYLQGATGFNISSNSVTDGRYGFVFGWSSNWGSVPEGPFSDCDIRNNSLDRGGLYPVIENYECWDFETIRFEDNTVNNRPIGFYPYLDGTLFDGADYGQLFLVSCTDVTIREGDFYGINSNRSESIYFDLGIASAINLLNCTLFDGADYSQLFLVSCTDVAVREGDFHGINSNRSESIYFDLGIASAVNLLNCTGCELEDVRFHNNTIGVSIQHSNDCLLRSCFIWENGMGINFVNSLNCEIYYNDIRQNTDGVFLKDSDGCRIFNNSIYENSRGLLLNSSSECLIIHNMIYNNTGVGISLDLTSHYNDIYENAFENNAPNAICEGTSNHWDNQVDTGNRWSDYSGEGPYIIDENDQDNYPIVDIETTVQPPPTGFDPGLAAVVGIIVGIVALVVIMIDRRQVVIVD